MQVSETLKELYRSDSIDKNMIAEFCRPGQTEPFLAVYDGSRFIDMSLEEALCSDDNIEWGSCEASQIKHHRTERCRNKRQRDDLIPDVGRSLSGYGSVPR